MIITKNGGSSHWSLPPTKRRRTLFLHGRQFQRIVQRRQSPSSHGGENPHAIAIMEQGILFYADAVHKNDPGF